MDGVNVIHPTSWSVSAEAASMDGSLDAYHVRKAGLIEVAVGENRDGKFAYRAFAPEHLRAWCVAVIEMIDREA